MTFQSIPAGIDSAETVISASNSSTTILSANATFTGAFVPMLSYVEIDFAVISDVNGTCYLELSNDGVTVINSFSFIANPTLEVIRRVSQLYARIRYVNGPTNQTTFNLQTLLRPISPGRSVFPLNTTITDINVAQLDLNVLLAKNISGTYGTIGRDLDGGLNVHVTDFPATQPISGTITANIGTTGGLALDSSLTTIDIDIKASQPRKLQDGLGNNITSQINGIQRALDVGIDVAGVQIDPRAQGTAASLSGAWPVEITDGTNILGTAAHPVRIDPTGTTTQPVSGTITANAGTGTFAENLTQIAGNNIATAATGIAKVGLTDGSGISITSTLISGHQSLDVNIIPNTNSVPIGSNISAYVSANQVFSVSTLLNMAIAGSDNPLILIKNPSGSGKILYVYKFAFGVTVANVSGIFRTFANPTVTVNGTIFTPISTNIGGGSPASVMQTFTLPTTSANGTSLDASEVGQNSNSLNFLQDFSIHVLAGQSLLITGNPLSNNRQASITIVWTEL